MTTTSLPGNTNARPIEWFKALCGLQRIQQSELAYYRQLLRDLENAFEVFPFSLRPESIGPFIVPSTSVGTKPRVHVDTTITSKGNLVVRWYPSGHYSISRGLPQSEWINETDFTHGALTLLDKLYPEQRPINELLFLRNFDYLPRASEKPLSPWRHCLLGAVTSLANEYALALGAHFEVSIGTYIQPIFVNGRAHGWKMYGMPRTAVVTCEIGGGAMESQVIPSPQAQPGKAGKTS